MDKFSMSAFAQEALRDPFGTANAVYNALPSQTAEGWTIWVSYVVYMFILSKFLPGTYVKGQPLDKKGTRLSYLVNGMLVHVITLLTFAIAVHFGYIKGGIVVDNFGGIFAAANLWAFALTLLHYLIPTIGGWAVSEGNPVLDLWFGAVLNPRLFGVDLKTFAYRPAMTGYGLVIYSLMLKQYELYGHITVGMALFALFSTVYIIDFYVLESHIFSMYDVIEERFGFMLIWGDYVWITFVFSLNAWFLLHHTPDLSPNFAVFVVLLFIVGFVVFRIANLQKDWIKADPKTTIWGSAPEYVDGRLLVSGFWGLMRKPNYLGDLMIAYSLALTCGVSSLLPFTYPIYLTTLLLNRALRDERRCAKKYGETWKRYVARVPYRIIPGLF